jgi:hypothetical protein
MPSPASIIERPILPLFSLADIAERLLIDRSGKLTLVYRVEPFHEPALDDSDFERIALQLTHTWSVLPERTTYQFLCVVDSSSAARVVDDVFRPVVGESPRHALYEALRASVHERFRALTHADGATSRELLQTREHYLAVSFEPEALKRQRRRQRLAFLQRRRHGQVESTFAAAVREADLIDQATSRALIDLGLAHTRLDDDTLARLMHALMSPDSASHAPLPGLSRRDDRDDLPDDILDTYPFLADTSPLFALTDDPLVIDRRFLRLGGYYVGIVAMKRLPDETFAGSLVPLLRLPIPSYRLSFRVHVLDQSREIAALARASRMADAWKNANLFGRAQHDDPAVTSLQRQKDEAIRRAYETSRRLVGLSLAVTLLARSADELDAHVRTTLSALAMARGLTGVREDYGLIEAFAASLPGGPELTHQVQKCDGPTASDLAPLYDFHAGDGRIPFTTPNSSIVLFDPWLPSLPSPHQLVFAGSGWGKSYAVQYQLACYEAHCLARGDRPPRLFLLDKGGSYRRFLEVRGPDARYLPFSPDDPPGIDVFRYASDDEALETHVSRLTTLLLDLLRVSEQDAGPAAFEVQKATLQQALFALYASGRASFDGLEAELRRLDQPRLAQALYPYREGALAPLFRDNPRLALDDSVNAVCWDLFRLDEHPDMKRVALRLAIYQIRKLASRAARARQTTFLVVDEAWDFLAGNMGSAFVVEALRSGRKEGLAVIGLSQQLEDFAHPAFRAAILGNVSSRLIGHPGRVSLETFRELLGLTERQLGMIQGLRGGADYREFLLVRNDTSEVVRVPSSPLIEKLFTTRHADMAEWERLRRDHADADTLTLLQEWAAPCSPRPGTAAG